MGSYKISLKKSVEKDLRKIDQSQIKKILNAIDSLAENPFQHNSRKLVGSNHTYRIRIGDYRVLYFVNEEAFEIEIQNVGHRRDVYRF